MKHELEIPQTSHKRPTSDAMMDAMMPWCRYATERFMWKRGRGSDAMEASDEQRRAET
jgi:hypothetical protein